MPNMDRPGNQGRSQSIEDDYATAHHHGHSHVGDPFNQGLQADVATLLTRRRAMGIAFGASVAGLVGCSTEDSTVADSTSGTSATPSTSASSGASATTSGDTCDVIPEETAGPYPGDGSNGPDVLSESGVIREDIRSSIGGASGTADGVNLQVKLTLIDSATGCTPLAAAAVYLWHATADGLYSMYSQGVTDENFLRGVQESGSDGTLQFTTVYPGCYDGRWPHIHFEVYPSLNDATSAANLRSTSQLAFPQDVCEVVYADSRYPSSASNLQRVSLSSDNVFGDDGGALQTATMSGNIEDGYVAELRVVV